jgi:hypothetical protein
MSCCKQIQIRALFLLWLDRDEHHVGFLKKILSNDFHHCPEIQARMLCENVFFIRLLFRPAVLILLYKESMIFD